MLQIKTHAAPDAFGGTGVFASEFIAAGTVIWRYHPAVDLFYSHLAYHALPRRWRDRIAKHVYPAIMKGVSGVLYSRDNDRFTNHSFTPNTRYVIPPHQEATDVQIVAQRDIAAGEEITQNYFDFVPSRLAYSYTEIPCYGFLLNHAGSAGANDRMINWAAG